MSHIRVLICRVDDPTTEQMTDLAAFDLRTPDLTTFESITALDDLETVTHETGNAILQRTLQARWDLIVAVLVAHSTASSVVRSRSWPMGTRPSPSPAASPRGYPP